MGNELLKQQFPITCKNMKSILDNLIKETQFDSCDFTELISDQSAIEIDRIPLDMQAAHDLVKSAVAEFEGAQNEKESNIHLNHQLDSNAIVSYEDIHDKKSDSNPEKLT